MNDIILLLGSDGQEENYMETNYAKYSGEYVLLLGLPYPPLWMLLW